MLNLDCSDKKGGGVSYTKTKVCMYFNRGYYVWAVFGAIPKRKNAINMKYQAIDMLGKSASSIELLM